MTQLQKNVFILSGQSGRGPTITTVLQPKIKQLKQIQKMFLFTRAIEIRV